MKCSSCGVWVHMLDLGNHVCAPPPIPAAPSLHDLRAGRGKLDDLRVNIHAAASGPGRAYGASLAARSPMYPGKAFSLLLSKCMSHGWSSCGIACARAGEGWGPQRPFLPLYASVG